MQSETATLRTGLPWVFVALNVIGGSAVLASYVYGVGEPEFMAGMSGGVSEMLRPIYTVSMALAAAGYFPMTAYLLLRVWPSGAGSGAAFHPWTLWYAMILFASAAWVPVTLAMLREPSLAAWWVVRGALFVAAIGSIGVLLGLVFVKDAERGPLWKLAVAGCVLFCNQTVVLDALVWPFFFPTPG